ncbi:MAG: transcriptional regulator TrmB [Microgenomates group bacterium Gr01-1014_7]|nr:MAG: transcriptional regulator TrmB [Microgenomates group bacterium Gr01-1014_7]
MDREQYYLELITSFGLNEPQSKIYLSCLKLGQTTVGEISKESGIQRTYVYAILQELKKLGLVSSIEIKGIMHFSPISLEGFKFLQKEKMDRFEAFMPELKTIEKMVDRPKVRFFEGREGIITALEDTFNQPEGSEMLEYSNGEGFFVKEIKFANWYIKERLKRKISLRLIAPDTAGTIEYFSQFDKQHRRVTRLVPAKDFPFTNEINIYANKMGIITLTGELMAVIIESESIANTQRAIFELAWRGAKGPFEHLNNL